MSSEQVTTVDLLRHGACEDGEIYRGTTDSALSDEGRRQMSAALAAHGGWTCVVSSPLSRCATVAGDIATQTGAALVIDEAFREVDFGSWEGREVADVWREEPDLVTAFYSDPGAVTPPGGEPMLAAQDRAMAAWEALVRRGRGEHHLLVSHGGIIRLLLGALLQLPLAHISRLEVSYASLARVRVYHSSQGDFPVLVFLQAGADAT